MAERSIVVRLKAEVSDLKRKLAEGADAAQKAGDRIGESITKNEQGINTLANGAGLLGAAMVAAAGVAVAKFADFDAAMSSVQASTMESASNMELLREAALDAGARTAFSATEAAGAIEELAKAGISTADILGGGLDGALDLAAAGGIGVAEAAETAASAMTQFGLSGSDVTHIADLLAAGAGKAQGGVSDLGAALNQSGLVASQMGLSIEETVGSLAAFASAGLIGSDAGTSFRASLLRLANPTDEAAKLMAELGIQAYDAGGQFVGMEALAGQLQSRLGGLTQEQRNAALAAIFGQDAIRTSAILYEQGAEGVREWTAAVNEQGYAAEVAATRLDNLKGDFEELGGAVETALIGMGEAGGGPLRALVQQATEAVNAFAEMPDFVQGALLSIVGGGGLVLLGLAGMGKLVVGINDAKNAMQGLGISAKRAGLLAGAAGGAIGIAAVALTVWASNAAEARARTEEFKATLDEFGSVTDDTISLINSGLAENRNNWFQDLLGKDPRSTISMAEDLGIAIEDLQGYIIGEADAIDRVNAAIDTYVNTGDMSRRAVEDRELSGQALVEALNKEAGALTESQRQSAEKKRADEEAGIAQEALKEQYDATVAAVEEQENALRDLISAQAEAAGIVASVMEAQAGFEQALDDATAAIEKNGATLDLNTQAGRDNQAALLDIMNAGYDVIASMEANGATQGELRASLQRTRDEFINTATRMGMTADEASALADEMGLIPESIKTTVNLQDNASAGIAGILYELNRLPNSRTVTINKLTNEVTVSSGRGNQVARAAGGIVYGPGTSTSDSIPARLSNGEYVIKADSVQRYGKTFFDNLNAQRFAVGGYVGSVRQSASGSAASAYTGPLVNVERVVQGTPQDVGAEVQWAMMTRGM